MLILYCPQHKSKLVIVMVKKWHTIAHREVVPVSIDMGYRPACASTYLGDVGESTSLPGPRVGLQGE